MKNNGVKDLILIVVAVIVLIVLVAGVSYAAFIYSKIGEVENVVTTGAITMSYTESQKGINLTDAMPMTDVTGQTLKDEGQIFDFTVAATITGAAAIDYAITAVAVEDQYLTNQFVKIYLTDLNDKVDSQFGSKPKRVSELSKVSANNEAGAKENELVLKTGTYKNNFVENYRLRMWVAEDYVGAGNGNMPQQVYKLRVNVYGHAAALQ